MITTVCMNPSFDKTASVSKASLGEVNRLQDVRVDVGGKGINVAIVLNRLGAAVRCVGCVGTRNSSSFLQLLAKEGLLFDYLSVDGEVRTNLKVIDRSSKNMTEWNEPGIRLNDDEFNDFISLLVQVSAKSEWVVLSGKPPAGCGSATYLRCMRTLPHQKKILDVSGDALLEGLKEQPFLIKPNLSELEEIVGCSLQSHTSIRDAAHSLLNRGAQNVVVSLGKDGAVLVNRSEALFAPALPLDVRSTVGAGAAMVGGTVFALDAGKDISEAFRYGVAAGAASVMTEGTQLLYQEDFQELLPMVRMEKL